MAKFTITHDQSGCIGCGACEALCASNWVMEEVDGEIKAILKKEHIDDDELQENKEAAEACPVDVIHLHDENNNKII